MKKIVTNLILSGVIMIGLLFANTVSANPASPDGEKKAKKETVQAKQERSGTKIKLEKQNTQPLPVVDPEKPAGEYTDPENPHNNADCSKAGFDRE